MDKKDVVHVYNGIIVMKRNEIETFVETCVDICRVRLPCRVK